MFMGVGWIVGAAIAATYIYWIVLAKRPVDFDDGPKRGTGWHEPDDD